MKILKEWKGYSEDYENCSCEHHYDHFLLENSDKLIKLHEFSNGIKYPSLVSRNNAMINDRGGNAIRGTVAGYGQNIENPTRSGNIQMIHGIGKDQARTRRLIYKVPSDSWPNSKEGPYTVVIQFTKDGPRSDQLASLQASERLKQLDVMVKCDCPFFIWNGPEYNAVANKYLYPAGQGRIAPPDPGYNPRKAKWDPNLVSPQSMPGYWKGDYADTAADKGIRDPTRQFFICKHIAAVFTNLDRFLRLPVSWYQASEKADAQGIPDPGYPGGRKARAKAPPPEQLSFMFRPDKS